MKTHIVSSNPRNINLKVGTKVFIRKFDSKGFGLAKTSTDADLEHSGFTKMR